MIPWWVALVTMWLGAVIGMAVLAVCRTAAMADRAAEREMERRDRR